MTPDDYDNDIAPLPKADDASYSEAVMAYHPDAIRPNLTDEELLQAIRTFGNLHGIHQAILKLRKKDMAAYNVLCRFFLNGRDPATLRP